MILRAYFSNREEMIITANPYCKVWRDGLFLHPGETGPASESEYYHIGGWKRSKATAKDPTALTRLFWRGIIEQYESGTIRNYRAEVFILYAVSFFEHGGNESESPPWTRKTSYVGAIKDWEGFCAPAT